MSQVKHVLVDKNKPVTFQAGQQFVVKVAATVVAKIEICSCKADSSTIYAKMVSVVDQSVAKASVFDANMNFLKTGYLRGKAIYQVVEEEALIAVFDIETYYPNHRQALVGKQFITGKVGEVYVVRQKVTRNGNPAPRGDWSTPSEDITYLMTCNEDGVLTAENVKTGSLNFGVQTVMRLDGQSLLSKYPLFNDYYVYRLIPNEPVVTKEPIYGIAKTVFDQTVDRYIVWSPGSRSPSQQIFTSAKQARYVAYRLTEQNKGQVFYWAKLEGYSQWGEILESSVG